MRRNAQAELAELSKKFVDSSEKYWRELGGLKPTLYVNSLGQSGPRLPDYFFGEGHGLPEGPVLVLIDRQGIEEFRQATTPAERTQLETLERASREFTRLCAKLAPLLAASGVKLLDLGRDERTNVAGQVLHWAVGSPELPLGITSRITDSCAFAIVSEAIDGLLDATSRSEPASKLTTKDEEGLNRECKKLLSDSPDMSERALEDALGCSRRQLRKLQAFKDARGAAGDPARKSVKAVSRTTQMDASMSSSAATPDEEAIANEELARLRKEELDRAISEQARDAKRNRVGTRERV